MTRYGQQFGPDFTFLGVPGCDLDDPASYADADVVILGAPFDGGTSHRPGHALRAAGDPDAGLPAPRRPRPKPGAAHRRPEGPPRGRRRRREMYSGDIERSLGALEAAVERVARAGAIPVVLGGDHSIAFPDAKGVANVLGHGRVSMIHFDAHADTGDIEFGRCGATASRCDGSSSPARCAATASSRSGCGATGPARDAGLDGRGAACGPTR